MSASIRIAFLAALASLGPATASHAMEDYLRASSSQPTAIALCGETNSDGEGFTAADCSKAGYDKLIAAIDKSFDSAIAKTPANVRPLLKRDQAWFNEMILEAAGTVKEVDEAELRENFVTTLRARAAVLDDVASGFGRRGVAGKWVYTFGSVTLTPAESGAYRLATDMRAYYGADKHRECKLNAIVAPAAGGWFSGSILPEDGKPVPSENQGKKPPSVKLRRQGDTLRVVMVSGDDDWNEERDECDSMWQITGSYFASGRQEAAEVADAGFVSPTFDCLRPNTASDEEICADPDLAENDRRLNNAWKALLPRLDEVTRRALIDDQRSWIGAQTHEFPEFLHPAWEKMTSPMHFTANARDHLDGLQRERIALLEGFDDKRTGVVGAWLAYNAVIKVTIDADGKIKGKGWKWDQGDWKAGCDFDMTGVIAGGTFRSDDQRKNPDTLERDHAMLIVNRLDDGFAKNRHGEKDDDAPKCRRWLYHSSTVRLFPAPSSPAIDGLPGSIR